MMKDTLKFSFVLSSPPTPKVHLTYKYKAPPRLTPLLKTCHSSSRQSSTNPHSTNPTDHTIYPLLSSLVDQSNLSFLGSLLQIGINY